MTLPTSFKTVTGTCLFLLCAVLASAQSKKAVVLINSVPHNVTIDKDAKTITEVGAEAKGYMRGFKNTAPQEEKKEFVIDAPQGELVPLTPEDEAKSGGFNAIEGNSMRTERRMVAFEAGYAVMDQSAVKMIDAVVKDFDKESGERLLITGHKRSENVDNELANNRIKSIRTYLELKGIPADKIETEIVVSQPLENRIAITFIQ